MADVATWLRASVSLREEINATARHVTFRPRAHHGDRKAGDEADIEPLGVPGGIVAFEPCTASAADLNMAGEVGAKV